MNNTGSVQGGIPVPVFHMKMVGLSSIITTVILWAICESQKTRNLSLKSPVVFSLYNTTNEWWLKPDRWQKGTLRYGERADEYSLRVIASSYDLGMSALAVATAVSERHKFPQLEPSLAYYHTSAYRWMLRQLSLYPDLLYNKLFETHKVWRRRFYYDDVLVPQWLRKSLVWVNKESWTKEEIMFKEFNKHARRIFDKYDRYPPKKFVSTETFSNSSSIFYPGQFHDKSYSD